MPLYEYQCSNCHKVHEMMQKFSDPALQDCPDCGGKVSKLMSLSSFALKGSGWYTTDYKRSSNTKVNGATQDTPATETKTESKSNTSETSSSASAT